MYRQLRDHIEKISPLTDQEYDLVCAQFEYRKFRKHQYLTQVGEPVKHHYFVLSGLLKLVFTTENGKQHIVSFAAEDWWESDFYAFFTQTKATMSLECIEDTEVLCLSLDGYRYLCATFHKMEHFFLEKANYGFIGAQRRIISSLTSDAKERFEQLQKQYPFLIQRIPKSLIAAYLGVSRETLSRLY